jgi:hypothetical protein
LTLTELIVVWVSSPPSWIYSRKDLNKGSVAFARAATRRADGHVAYRGWGKPAQPQKSILLCPSR